MRSTYIVLAYVLAVTAANLLVYWSGPWFSVVNSFLLIGLDLSARDILHDRWQGNWLPLRIGLLIATGSALSYALNPAGESIALASFVAFASSAVADSLTYHAARKMPYLARSNFSNLMGAAVDSAIFPTLAFGVLMPGVVLGQFTAKVLGGALWSIALRPARTAA